MDALAELALVLGIMFVVTAFGSPESSRSRSLLVAAFRIFSLRYAWWRTFESTPAWEFSLSSIISYAILLLELVNVWRGMVFVSRFRAPKSRSQEATSNERWFGDAPPLVNLLIPTFNEEKRIIEKTLVGAIGQDYPNHRVWILDDGNRDWLRDLCVEKKVEYIRRSSNAGYKAGNVQNAIDTIRRRGMAGDFWSILDADFVARPQFLRRTVALMHDKSVGVVQTPQLFYNEDPFQLVLGKGAIPDDLRWFFTFLLPTLDAQGGALCCGTSFVIRDEALQAIGGIPHESVTEDTLTTYKLWRKGFSTAFLNERLSMGLAAEGMAEFLAQRRRWALGGAQVAMGPWGLNAGTGLLKRMRAFFDAADWAFEAGQKWIWLFLPLFYWYFGIYYIHAEFSEAISYIAPLLAVHGAMQWLGRGTQWNIHFNATYLVASFVIVPATIEGAFGRTSGRFVVTDKGKVRSELTIHWPILKWILLYLLLYVVALGLNLFVPTAPGYNAPYSGIFYYFSILNIFQLVFAALPCIELPQLRAEHRHETNEAGSLRFGDAEKTGVVTNLSTEGGFVKVEGIPNDVDDVELGLSGGLTLPGKVVRTTRSGVAIRFDLDAAVRERLIRRIYCTGDYVKHPYFYPAPRRVLALVMRVLFGLHYPARKTSSA